MLVIEQAFIEGYVRSIMRSSDLPASLRGVGVDHEGVVKHLCEFVNSGRRPKDPAVAAFIGAPPQLEGNPARSAPDRFRRGRA